MRPGASLAPFSVWQVLQELSESSLDIASSRAPDTTRTVPSCTGCREHRAEPPC